MYTIYYQTAVIGRYATEAEMEAAYAMFVVKGLNEEYLAWSKP